MSAVDDLQSAAEKLLGDYSEAGTLPGAIDRAIWHIAAARELVATYDPDVEWPTGPNAVILPPGVSPE